MSARLKAFVTLLALIGLLLSGLPPAQAGTRHARAVTSGGAVSNVTAAIDGPSAAAGALSAYAVSFTTSSTGGMDGADGGAVTVSFPPTVGLGGANAVITDTTTGQQVGSWGCCGTGSNSVTIGISGTVNAGDSLTVQFHSVNNPAPAGSYTVSVSTSSDPTPVTSTSFATVTAQDVSGVTAVNDGPSAAAGALSAYAVSFTTSSTGGMDGADSGGVTVSFPPTVGLGGANAVITDTTTGQQVGSWGCCGTGSNSVTIGISGTVNAGDSLTVQFHSVNNPAPAGSYTVSVSTTSDHAPVTSTSFTTVKAQTVTGVTAANDGPTAAAGAPSAYAITFTTSSTGGMDGADSGGVTVSFPPTVGLGGANAVITDTTTGQQVGSWGCCGTGANSVTIGISGTVNPGDSLKVQFHSVNNPAPAGSYTVSVSTTSDPTPVTSTSFTTVKAHDVSGVTAVNDGPSAAAGALSAYAISFTTSSTGGMDGADNGAVTVSFPATISLASANAVITDTTTGQQVGSWGCCGTGSNSITIGISGTVNPGDSLKVQFHSVNNPAPAGSYTVSVSTSSDHAAVTSTSFTTVKAQTVTGVTAVNDGPSAAAGALSGYAISFTTSSTGGMDGADNGAVTVTFPATISLASANAVITDTTTGQQVGSWGCCGTGSNSVTIGISGTVNPGDNLTVQFHSVNNPAPAGSYTVSVSTTSDHAPVTSTSFTTVKAQTITGLAASLSNQGAATAGVTYQLSFTTSSTGGMDGANGGAVTVTFPATTSLVSANAVITDTTTGQQVGSWGCCGTGSDSVTIGISGTVLPGDVLSVQMQSVVNPTAPGTYKVSVSTTSDLAPVAATFTTVPSASASGTVADASGAPVSGAPVQACPAAGSACQLATSGSDGSFTVDGLSSGPYTIVAYPPANVGGAQSDAVTVTASPPTGISGVALQLPKTLVMPRGVVLVTPSAKYSDTVPTVNWGEPSTYSTTGCDGGTGMLTIFGVNTSTGQSQAQIVPLTETVAGSGQYSAAIPALYPLHGTSSVQQSILCPGHTPILPDGGPSTGGTQMLIGGSGFTGATAVTFGGKPATSFSVLTDGVIAAVAPAGTGVVQVSVTTSSGPEAIGDYSYYDVTGISTGGCSSGCGGPYTGGTTVTITGDGFTNVSGVSFGLLPAASFTVDSPTEITAVAPFGVGTVNVQVAEGFSASQPTASDAFSYSGGPPGASSITEGTSPSSEASYAGAVLQLPPFPGCGGATGGAGGICQGVQQLYDGANTTLEWVSEEVNPLDSAFWVKTVLTAVFAAAFGWEAGVAAAFFAALSALHAAFKFICRSKGKCPSFSMLIDPSGTIVDTHGNPISGATATLLGQSTPNGPFTPVPASTGAIEPARNPETTGASGQFRWNALAGNYQVKASAPHCTAPGIPAQKSVSTPPFTIPPPKDGLIIALACKAASPPKPAVTSLSPASGPTSGYTSVTVTGTGLADTRSVAFGTTPAVSFTVLSPDSIDATAPPGTSTAQVTVTTLGGTSAHTAADRFSYFKPESEPGAPTVTSVSPRSGPLAGGTTVTIEGTGLRSAASVSFGGSPTTQIKVLSATKLRATVPAGQAGGPVAVTVMAAGKQSAPGKSSLFTYQFPQTVSFTSKAPSPALYGGTYRPAASRGASGKPVTFTIDHTSHGCTIKRGLMTFTGLGSCVIDANQVGTANYAPAPQVQQVIAIGLALLTVSARNQARYYGAANPKLTAGLSGFVLGQDESDSGVTGTPVCTTTATARTKPGRYPIACSQGSLQATNYTFKLVAGTLTIKPAPIKVSASPMSVPDTTKPTNVTFRASLHSATTGRSLGGIKVSFTVKGHTRAICTATTNKSGIATCKVKTDPAALIKAGSYTASVAKSADYAAAHASAAIHRAT